MPIGKKKILTSDSPTDDSLPDAPKDSLPGVPNGARDSESDMQRVDDESLSELPAAASTDLESAGASLTSLAAAAAVLPESALAAAAAFSGPSDISSGSGISSSAGADGVETSNAHAADAEMSDALAQAAAPSKDRCPTPEITHHTEAHETLDEEDEEVEDKEEQEEEFEQYMEEDDDFEAMPAAAGAAALPVEADVIAAEAHSAEDDAPAPLSSPNEPEPEDDTRDSTFEQSEESEPPATTAATARRGDG